MDHVVIVCGYGCHLVTPDSRDTPLKNYLDRVVQFLNTHRPSAVVLCGGYTQQKSAPGVSEAALMRDYITPGLHEDYNPAIRLEEDS
ncbi:MAG: hypothetical protein Q8P35_02980, partial [Candidatus Yanofskybacteria bacterium]|nr:hypothetical protein [Candidatus Yanofskybacteria bacterium]